MSRILLGALVIVSCAGTTATATTDRPVSTTRVPWEETTTVPSQDLVIQDCSSPPATFSPLCEIVELLEDWYVDAPIDYEPLADLAIRGLSDFTSAETEEPPRTLFCAVPTEAFHDFCEEMANRVLEHRIPVGQAVEAAVAHMISIGLDPFTYYLPPDQVGGFRNNGIVGGIGVLLDARDAVGSKCTQIIDPCRLEVVVVLEDNPAFDVGLLAGDQIVAVDGQAVEGKGFASVVALIAGDETGAVSLTIDRDGETLVLDMERMELLVPTVDIELPSSSVGYIKIPDFEADIPGLVYQGLTELTDTGADTLVVDLRDNPGGLVDSVVQVADLFISDGVVMISDGPGEHLEYPAASGGLATSQRLIVLVNRGTASAAEILTGALRDRRNAVVVGTDTFGKDAVQIPFRLRNGGEFIVVVARWSTPGGDTAAVDGLSPDVFVDWPNGATIDEIVDLALEATS